MGEVWQEMYCSECKSYFGFMLCTSNTGDVEVVCGVCKHKHARHVTAGRIDGDAKTEKYVMTVEVMRSACYPESRTIEMQKSHSKRNAMGIKANEGDLSKPMTDAEKVRQDMINELWLDKYARDTNG